VLVSAFKRLRVERLSIFVKGASLQGEHIGVAKIRNYLNKKFCKMTIREDWDCSESDIPSRMTDKGESEGKTIFGFEGFMLPSKIEQDLARRSGFDFYTVTNLSFMDIALRLNYNPNLFCIGVNDLGNDEEEPQT
jgi:hypothetical protein